MSRRGGAAGALRGASQRTIGILAAIGAAMAWGLGATTSDYVLSSGMGNDTFLVLELSVGFVVLMVIGALRGELAGLPERVAARLSWADDWRKAGPYSGALIEGDAGKLTTALTEIATLPGPIVLAQAGTPRLDWLVEEVSTSVNTTAAGGNASLMAVA